ncbi:serine hydrolase [Bradyrhizobium sp. 179]|uniref:serine hydrolase domain-containing protein n=1 Tax=Bradyrhizobium sp. 179 TaxID=2782648 RepID=UPI001FF77F2F|nr:serine hydrolase [Bradyrhizobium sp. 179]MCK1541597.1 serine hydrolase [Bradyrhizobium sp. 179]
MWFRMLTLAALVACAQAVSPSFVMAAEEQAAQDILWPTKAWATSTPEEQGMDSARLARLVETVGGYNQDSLTIIRHGRIVTDAYYAPYLAGITHDLRSVTKSVVSTLTGIQVQKGQLDSVDRAVVDLFPDKRIDGIDDRKKAMTVQSLLDMTSGLAWIEKAYTPDETIMKMYAAPDRTAFVLNQPMATVPGASFNYNGGNPYLLSALVNVKSGQNAFDFAKKELFEPLGIKSAKWGQVDDQGVTDGEAGLYLAPHDMARIGYLYLQGGVWEGKRLIPSAWVERAKAGPVEATFGFHYGNLWWSNPEKGTYMARGRHSQLILVIPRLDVIVVMTGYLRDTEFFSTTALTDDVSAAVKSDKPLPEDPIARALLANAIKRAATERPAAVGGTPELAAAISGKTFNFPDNKLRVKSFTLNFFDTDSSWLITSYAEKGPRQFSGLMGLDGVYRKSPPAPYGINAVRGRWLNERTFMVERRILGHGESQLWTLAFDGDKVTVNFENTDGFKVELRGERGE